MNGIFACSFQIVVKRKPIDVSFSGVMHSIVGSMKSNHGRGNKGTSENFYGNALKKNQPVSIDMDDLEDPTLPLGENTLCDYYSDMDMESDVDNAMRAYRRQSMASRTPPFHRFTPDSMESESASEDQETHIIECKTVASSNLGSQFGLEDIVGCFRVSFIVGELSRVVFQYNKFGECAEV